MAVGSIREALQELGYARAESPPRPVLHGRTGSLVSFALLDLKGPVWVGLWIDSTGARVFSNRPSEGPGSFHGLSGVAAEIFDLFAEAARGYLERTEEVDAKLAQLQEKNRILPVNEVWKLQREMAVIRAHIGRALVAAAELAGPAGRSLPGFHEALPSLVGELSRVQDVAANVRQALSDLVLLRDAEQSNRLADVANQLSRASNRVAALANISNIRMLGLTYIAFILAIVTAVVLFPNTGATILGMPSAAWVPGIWVDVILIVLTVVPLVLVFSRPWVRQLLGAIGSYEFRATEGMEDLPEVTPDEAARGEVPDLGPAGPPARRP
ncbi:MAG TPA: hypothetical protein VJS68_03410 [Thermoplasmata archaeon]|nr:hypothetical protein [Thermoplasmata archaeon]